MLLSLIIWLPLLAALLVGLSRSDRAARGLALVASLGVFAITLVVLARFDGGATGFQLAETRAFLPDLGVQYALGVDGISLWLVVLTGLLTPLVILGSFGTIQKNVRGYYAAMLALETGMLGAFLALDLLWFYLFWELMLLPMFFIIGVWGGENRLYATIKFVLFTLFGSLAMLVAILVVARDGGSFSYVRLLEVPFGPEVQRWAFLAFALAFVIKVPLVPFHTWLPDAHTEAPAGGSVILAGVLLKLGGYGLLRFCLPLFPQAAREFAPWMMGLAVVGIIHGALAAAMQPDVKRLVAYSSVSHMGFIVLGIFTFSQIGMEAAVLQMVNHGITTGALFLLVGMLYDRRHTRNIEDFGGLARVMPVFSFFFLVSALASAGVPGLNGFIGEFLLLFAAWTSGFRVLAALGSLGIIFGAWYLLSLYCRVFLGPVRHEANRGLRDLTAREIAVLVPLVALMVGLGLQPSPVLRATRTSIQTLLVDRLSEEGEGAVIAAGSPHSESQVAAPAEGGRP